MTKVKMIISDDRKWEILKRKHNMQGIPKEVIYKLNFNEIMEMYEFIIKYNVDEIEIKFTLEIEDNIS